MLLLITKPATSDEVKKAATDLDGYIKVVIDVEKNVLTAGGKWHVEGEQLLLEKGSQQKDLWGGGLDLETNQIDYDSMINIRPSQSNPSREVMSQEIRKQMDEIIRALLHV